MQSIIQQFCVQSKCSLFESFACCYSSQCMVSFASFLGSVRILSFNSAFKYYSKILRGRFPSKLFTMSFSSHLIDFDSSFIGFKN